VHCRWEGNTLAFLVHDSIASNVLFQFEGGRYGRWEGVGELGRCENTNSGGIECTLDALQFCIQILLILAPLFSEC
jgi:hypothetical protein